MANNTTVRLALIDAILNVNGTLAKTVENVTLKLTMQEAKANTRMSKFEQQLPTLIGVEIEVNFPSDSADTASAALKSACINQTSVLIVCSDGGSIQFTGYMGVFGMDNSQELAGVVMNKYTLKPCAVGAAGSQPALA